MNVYLRDWKAFYPNTDEGVDGEYNYKDLAAEASEGAGLGTGNFVTLLGGGFLQDNTVLLTLANSTDSIVVDETAHTITLDINKTVYGVYGYIKQIVNNLTENTTLSGLLKCSAVKYYVNAYLGDVTGEELFQTVLQAIAGGGVGGAGGATPFTSIVEGSPLAAIMPQQGEMSYDYIMRMLDSEDFAMIAGKEEPLGKTKIVDMLDKEVTDALKNVKDRVNAVEDTVLTETAIIVPSEDGEQSALAGTALSGLSLVYTFDEQNVLQSVDLYGKMSREMNGTAVEMELELGVAFESKAITEFENIGAYTVNVYDEANSTMIVKTVAQILGSANKN
ncbi:MAG: hypothetical protein K2K04_06950, partial [Clostridia bacterium]|nr:hypothetical protein [Clostridia bacterium]